ncbi:hypothetical protein R1D35_25615 [Escherichia coli]|nr:hypothetical protein [Escherichia coli]
MTKAGYAPEKKPEYRLPGQTGMKGIFCFIAEQCNGETRVGSLTAAACHGLKLPL